MPQNKTVLLIILLLLALTGAFFVMQKGKESTPSQVTSSSQTSQTNPSDQPTASTDTQYPQHITPIPNSDEVRYAIPEIGIKLKLQKDFAEDLIYEYETLDEGNRAQKTGTIYFSLKSLAANGTAKLSGSDYLIGAISKIAGQAEDDSSDFIQSRLKDPSTKSQFKQFPTFYLFFEKPQGSCVLDESRPISEKQTNMCYIFQTAEVL